MLIRTRRSMPIRTSTPGVEGWDSMISSANQRPGPVWPSNLRRTKLGIFPDDAQDGAIDAGLADGPRPQRRPNGRADRRAGRAGIDQGVPGARRPTPRRIHRADVEADEDLGTAQAAR